MIELYQWGRGITRWRLLGEKKLDIGLGEMDG